MHTYAKYWTKKKHRKYHTTDLSFSRPLLKQRAQHTASLTSLNLCRKNIGLTTILSAVIPIQDTYTGCISHWSRRCCSGKKAYKRRMNPHTASGMFVTKNHTRIFLMYWSINQDIYFSNRHYNNIFSYGIQKFYANNWSLYIKSPNRSIE